MPAVADSVPREARFVMEGSEAGSLSPGFLGIFWEGWEGTQFGAAGGLGYPAGWMKVIAMGSYEAG